MKTRFIYIALAALAAAQSATAGVWDELAILARGDSEREFVLDKYNFLQPTAYTSGLFFDYDNDGCLDLLIMGKGGDWNVPASNRFMLLYHNQGPEAYYAFRPVADTGLAQAADDGYYNPVSAGDFDRDGYVDLLVMSNDGSRHVDLYLNQKGTGRFVNANLGLHGASNGSVMLADLDGDGWLDIEYSGYADDTATALKLYRNNHDLTVSDISADAVTGAFQGQSTVADINGDGRLDIISCGNGDNWVCLSQIYLNQGADASGKCSWKKVVESESSLKGASRANPLVVDLNGDGRMDMVINGEPSDGSGYRTRIYYGRADGTFELDATYPIVAVNQDGGINMADRNGDGNMDIIVGGYLGTNDGDVSRYSAPLRVYDNTGAQNTRPEAPSSVTARQEEDRIVIEWEEGSDAESAREALRYNVMVRNDRTGTVAMLIPADASTGRLLVGTDLQTSLGAAARTYSIATMGSGSYTVGVQTLDQAYAPSAFRTLTLDVASVEGVEAQQSGMAMTLNGKNLEVTTSRDATVEVYTPDGRLLTVAQAFAPCSGVDIEARGLVVVKVSGADGSLVEKFIVK